MPDFDPSNPKDSARRPDSERSPEKQSRPDADHSAQEAGDDTLQTGLTELNRRLRELREDLTGGIIDAAAPRDADVEPAAAPPQPPVPPAQPAQSGDAQGAPRVHLGASPPPPDPQQRVHSILDDAQQMADEIMRNARRQVAETQPAPSPTVPTEVTDAATQVANALRQTQELLGLGQELLTSSHGVLEALGKSTYGAEAQPAPRPAQPSWPPRPETVPPPYPQPAATPPPPAYPLAQQPPAAPQPGVYAPPAELVAPQPGTYPPPFQPPAESQIAEPVPTQPLVHHGQVTLTAGPLADVAAAAVLERAIEHVPAIARARVKRFVDDRAVIELVLSEAVTLAEELRRVLPYPFEVQSLGRSELDIVIVTKPESNGAGNDGFAPGETA